MKTQDLYHKEFVEVLFNNISISYDKVNSISTFGISKTIRERILNLHFKQSKKRVEVLDLMSGNGETWNAIKAIFPNANITALDFSREMYLKSMEINKTQFNNDIKILNEDILENRLENNSYDIVICAFGLKHFNVKQTELLASEVFRILKSNGQFIFFEISVPTNKILKAIFIYHFKFFLPFVAKQFSNKSCDYKLLWVYLQKFENCKIANKIFESLGLDCNYQKYFAGITTSIHGIKK